MSSAFLDCLASFIDGPRNLPHRHASSAKAGGHGKQDQINLSERPKDDILRPLQNIGYQLITNAGIISVSYGIDTES